MNSYWDLLAHQFQHQQPPLRPCAEDLRIVSGIIRAWCRDNPQSVTNALLLGVTPEIAGLPWPANTFLTAIEKSQAMIDVVWPGNISGHRQVIRGEWLEVEFKDHSLDLVVGDGFLTAFAYPHQHSQFAARISQWLSPNGVLIARLFARTDRKETLEQVRADLQANRITRFDALKWRLGMALQESTGGGVLVDDIYQAWARIEEEEPSLPERAGWPRPTVDTIKLYAGRKTRYSFPTVEEIKAAFAPHLQCVSVTAPAYDFGAHCPIFVFRSN